MLPASSFNFSPVAYLICFCRLKIMCKDAEHLKKLCKKWKKAVESKVRSKTGAEREEFSDLDKLLERLFCTKSFLSSNLKVEHIIFDFIINITISLFRRELETIQPICQVVQVLQASTGRSLLMCSLQVPLIG